MSRPFPDTFEDGRSPLSPLSGGPSSSISSISYQANVNRRKTKKWTDAKPVSYGGDDWGDEYDDEYDAAPPPPQEAPQPTGYRQPGQGMPAFPLPAGSYGIGRKPYGDLPSGLAIAPDRSATLPPHLRRNSFGDDDERRSFSSGPTPFPPQSAQGPQPLYVQTQQPHAEGFRGPGPQPMQTPLIQAPGGFPETPYSAAESQRLYIGEQNQQPYQQPYQQSYPISPVNARGIPVRAGYGRNASPMSAGRSGSPSTFAPRNGSLSQGSASEVGYDGHSRERSQEPTLKPWPGPGVSSPGGSAVPAAGKALPFVRPSDIYKRLEEELTKERLSMESGRPSMDSITRDRAGEMSPPPAPSTALPPPIDPYTRGRSGSQSEYTDSGRRLGQSLEPVVERQSEYSFMNTSARSPEVAQKLEEIKGTENSYQPARKPFPVDAPQISYNDTPQQANDSEHDSSFEMEKRRRFSTSPKLPDLNRMSGFGFDMWGEKPSEPRPEPARPVVSTLQSVTNTQEPTLQREPSLGFNSVVHQAFDNDSLSDARDPQRTDSGTSAGTAGISPINPRGPLIRQDYTPMITEENEPNSRPVSGQTVTKQGNRADTPDKQIAFLPGHRRDLSAPISANSRDNSPARTPVVRQSAVFNPGVQVHVAEESETSISPQEERQIDEAASYERYPRPPIPGGWTSYATTAGESIHKLDEPSVNAPADTSQIAPYTAEIIASNPLPDEFSPTRDRETDDVALPTPDPHMGPIGNPYSAIPVDPRIDARNSQAETPASSKSADTITGLAPPTINHPCVSPGSSTGPTPPPKDTPRMAGFGEDDYFPPTVPLKPRTAEEVAAAEGLAAPQRPAMMPTLSTNTSPCDDENDKLRKEIVKSLSPRQSVSGPSSGLHQGGSSMLGVTTSDLPRESMYLPAEYESYWNDDDPSLQEAPPVQPQQDFCVSVTAASPASPDTITPPIPELNPRRISRTSMGSMLGGFIERRLSSDQGQQRAVSQDRSNASTPALASDASPSSKPWNSSLTGNGSPQGRLPVDLQRADSASPAPLSIRSAKTDRTSEVSSEKDVDEEAQSRGILEMAAAAGAAFAATLLPIGGPSMEPDATPEEADKDMGVPSLQGVVVDEDKRIHDKALSAEVAPVSATTAPQDIPTMINVVPPPSDPFVSQSAMLPSPLNISRPATAVPAQSDPRPAIPSNQPSPLQFREIMVMPSPAQRIEAYNKTREQYAQMDGSLADWLAAQNGAVPLTPPQGLSQDSNRSRAGSAAHGSPAAPYYQQYLNASSTSASAGPHIGTPMSNMSTPQRQSTLGSMGLGSQGGFGSSGGRSGHQAQVAKEKGKELLHSAGMFGGAVGKKSKGLFRKGTSRWLGGSGGSGDKVE